MADATEKEENEETKLIEPIFDDSLGAFLLKHKFTHKNIDSILGPDTGVGIPHYRAATSRRFGAAVIDSLKSRFNGGCIFVLSTGRRDGTNVYWSKFSSDEIRRMVAMKAFL